MELTLYKIAVLLVIYKIVCLLCGALFCYFGFILFLKGIYPNDGELTFEGFKTRIYLKKIGPGIFFAIFGTVIICFTIFQPLNFEQGINGSSAKNYSVSKKSTGDTSTSLEPPLLPDSIK